MRRIANGKKKRNKNKNSKKSVNELSEEVRKKKKKHHSSSTTSQSGKKKSRAKKRTKQSANQETNKKHRKKTTSQHKSSSSNSGSKRKKRSSHVAPTEQQSRNKLNKKGTVVDKTKTENKLTRSSGKKTKVLSDAASVIALSLAIIVTIVMGTMVMKFSRAEVVSGSMEPTLSVKDQVVIINGRSVERFNLVVFYPPDTTKEKYVKRVIGIPGDLIEYKDDILYVNGTAMDELYLEEYKEKFLKGQKGKDINYTEDFTVESIPGIPKGTVKIPEGMYLMLGDNRRNSQDSRFIGLIPENNIVGVVWKKAPLPEKKK